MGKIKHIDYVRDFFKKTPVVTAMDIRIAVKNPKYTHLLIQNMVKRGEIKRLKKGFYTIHEDPILSVFCFKPAYVGLQNALSIHNIWEQETNVVLVTSKAVRNGGREILGENIVIHKISPDLIFGFELMKHGDFYIPVSDLEKTLIDLIYFKEKPADEVLESIKQRIDREKLALYLEKYSKKFKKTVMKVVEA